MCWCVLVLFTRLSEGGYILEIPGAQRDLTDATAALQREVTERAKEHRRQHAADEERKRADEELAKIQANADAAERACRGLQQQLAAGFRSCRNKPGKSGDRNTARPVAWRS